MRAGGAGREGLPQKKLTKAGQARARAARLRLAYFPPGWTEKPHQKSAGDSDPRCSYYNSDQSDLVELGEYDSPDFQLPDGSSVSSSSGVFRTAAMAKAGYSRVARPQLAKCLAELSRKSAGPANTTIFASRRLRFPRYGDRADVAVFAIGLNRPLSTELVQFLVAKLAQQAE